MASHYAEAGSPFITDAARETLSAELAEKYDHNNIIVLEGAEFVVGEYEGKFLIGVYVKSIEQSQYVFQFYPVHPLWMAIVGTAFGSTLTPIPYLFLVCCRYYFSFAFLEKSPSIHSSAFWEQASFALAQHTLFFQSFPHQKSSAFLSCSAESIFCYAAALLRHIPRHGAIF